MEETNFSIGDSVIWTDDFLESAFGKHAASRYKETLGDAPYRVTALTDEHRIQLNDHPTITAERIWFKRVS